MRIVVALMLSLVAINIHAAKPTPDPEPTEPVFTGYSSGTLPSFTDTSVLWVELAPLCKETYGDSAIAANSDHMIAAINDGTYISPEQGKYAVYILAKNDIGVGVNEFGRVSYINQFGTTGYFTGDFYYHVACAQ